MKIHQLFLSFFSLLLIGCGKFGEYDGIPNINPRESLDLTAISTDDIDSLTYRYVTLDLDGGTRGYSVGKFLIGNRGKRSVWIHGDGGRFPHYYLEYWDEESSSWINASNGFSGTGARNHALAPAAEREIWVGISAEIIDRPIRVGLSLSMSPTASNRVIVWSTSIDLERFDTDVTLHERNSARPELD